jgi:ketosteroid isomerase-like protein
MPRKDRLDAHAGPHHIITTEIIRGEYRMKMGGYLMDREKARNLAERVLSAWNSQDVDGVVSCYTEDCIYLDPNTRGPVKGHDSLRKYLSKLFQDWKMHWSLREFFLFDDKEGGAFLWHATLTPSGDGTTLEVDGMDLVLIREEKLSRNEVYFDRMALLANQ